MAKMGDSSVTVTLDPAAMAVMKRLVEAIEEKNNELPEEESLVAWAREQLESIGEDPRSIRRYLLLVKAWVNADGDEWIDLDMLEMLFRRIPLHIKDI